MSKRKYKTIPEEFLKYIIDFHLFNDKINSHTAFYNDSPLKIEIGCGNGHFLSELALANSDINYIGIDIAISRIVKSCRKAAYHNIDNIKFIPGNALELLTNFVAQDSIDTYYINFPDPWPKRRHHKHRLFNRDVLNLLYQSLSPDGLLYFVTDHNDYFNNAITLIESDNRFINTLDSPYTNEIRNYPTSIFEDKWKKEGKTIYAFIYRKISQS